MAGVVLVRCIVRPAHQAETERSIPAAAPSLLRRLRLRARRPERPAFVRANSTHLPVSPRPFLRDPDRPTFRLANERPSRASWHAFVRSYERQAFRSPTRPHERLVAAAAARRDALGSQAGRAPGAAAARAGRARRPR